MESFHTIIGIEHRVTSPYSPRTNGGVERTNKTLIDSLNCHASKFPDEWPIFLDYVLLAFRTMKNQSTNKTPFEIMFGRPHNGFNNFMHSPLLETADGLALSNRAIEIKKLIEGTIPAVCQQIQHAQIQQRLSQDNRHSAHFVDQPLTVGEIVYTKVMNHQKKLSGPRFLGPYKIESISSGGNYKLVAASGRRLPRSFPLNQLRLIDSRVAERIWQQAVDDENDVQFPVDRLLNHRSRDSGVREYLIRWSGYSPEFDSWEPETNISPDLIGQYWGLPSASNSPSTPSLAPTPQNATYTVP